MQYNMTEIFTKGSGAVKDKECLKIIKDFGGYILTNTVSIDAFRDLESLSQNSKIKFNAFVLCFGLVDYPLIDAIKYDSTLNTKIRNAGKSKKDKIILNNIIDSIEKGFSSIGELIYNIILNAYNSVNYRSVLGFNNDYSAFGLNILSMGTDSYLEDLIDKSLDHYSKTYNEVTSFNDLYFIVDVEEQPIEYSFWENRPSQNNTYSQLKTLKNIDLKNNINPKIYAIKNKETKKTIGFFSGFVRDLDDTRKTLTYIYLSGEYRYNGISLWALDQFMGDSVMLMVSNVMGVPTKYLLDKCVSKGKGSGQVLITDKNLLHGGTFNPHNDIKFNTKKLNITKTFYKNLNIGNIGFTEFLNKEYGGDIGILEAYIASHNDNIISYLVIDPFKKKVLLLETKEGYRRRGVATQLLRKLDYGKTDWYVEIGATLESLHFWIGRLEGQNILRSATPDTSRY